MSADADAAQLAKAKTEGEVNLYTGVDQTLSLAIAAEFTKVTGIKVNTLLSASSELTTRINQEETAGIHQADVIWTGSSADTLQLKGLGYLTPYAPYTTAQILPSAAIDPQGYYYNGYSLRIVMAYNTNQLQAADAPTSWKDLTDPKWSGKLVVTQPATSVGVAILMYELSQLYGWDTVAQIGANKPLQVGSTTDAANTVIQGERAVSMTSVYSSVRTQPGVPVAPIFPTEGQIILPGGLALFAQGPHPNAARAFEDFLYSLDAQQIIANTNRDAVVAGVTYPAGWVTVDSHKSLVVDWNAYNAARADVLAKFTQYFTQ